MRVLYTFLLFVHVFAVAVWVGGMFVMHFAVRPSASLVPDVPTRLTLLSSVLSRFMAWAGLAVILVLVTGIAMIFGSGGFRNAHLSVHLMLAIGLLMMGLYAHIRFAPFKRMRMAVSAGNWQAAGTNLDVVRKLVLTNLVLGVVVIAIATVGRAAL
jgi:uncharacterized membrane protein